MGAAMVSLIEHARADHTPTATAWALCAGTAAVLVTIALLTATLQAWPEWYRPLSLTCVAAAMLCLGLGAVRPASG
jgi:hypothetical protein